MEKNSQHAILLTISQIWKKSSWTIAMLLSDLQHSNCVSPGTSWFSPCRRGLAFRWLSESITHNVACRPSKEGATATRSQRKTNCNVEYRKITKKRKKQRFRAVRTDTLTESDIVGSVGAINQLHPKCKDKLSKYICDWKRAQLGKRDFKN